MRQSFRLLLVVCATVSLLICLSAASVLGDTDADIQIGHALVASGDYDAAIPVFQRIVDSRSSQTPEALRMIGFCHQKQRSYSTAVELYHKVLSDYPESTSARSLTKPDLAYCHAKLHEWSKALPVYQALLTEKPDQSANWLFEISSCNARQGKMVLATQTIEQCLTRALAGGDPELVETAKAMRGFRYISQGGWDQALAIYQDLIRDYPSRKADWQFRMGLCYKGKRDYARAIEMFASVASDSSAGSTAGLAKLRTAECLCIQGKLDEAAASMDALLQQYPDLKADILLSSARLQFIYARNFAKAEAAASDLLRLCPQHHLTMEARHLIGLALLDDGKIEEAKAWFTGLITSDPSDGRWEFWLAYCSYRAGSWAEARDAIQAAYDKHPDGEWRVQAKYFIGDCSVMLQDYTSARSAFENAASEFEGSFWAHEAGLRVAELDKRLGKNGKGAAPVVASSGAPRSNDSSVALLSLDAMSPESAHTASGRRPEVTGGGK